MAFEGASLVPNAVQGLVPLLRGHMLRGDTGRTTRISQTGRLPTRSQRKDPTEEGVDSKWFRYPFTWTR